MIKRIVCVALCLILTFTFAGCGGKEDKKPQKPNSAQSDTKLKEISMLYCRADTFNPYTAASEINRNLCELLYEPLVKTDNSYNPVKRIAKSVTLGDKSCAVEIRDCCFSDGAKVTANDVIYSYNLAKSSATSHAAQLYEITKAEATGEKTVLFTLNVNDPYFENLLDFPIIKAESEKIADSDGVLQPPIGSGRYILSSDKSYLYLNENFYGKKGKIKKISLIDTPDQDAVSHYVEVGAVSFYYAELGSGNIVRMSGKKAEVNLNNLVYMGINDSYGLLGNKNLRYALSSAINRSGVCSNSYHNNATPASGFYNPVFGEVSAVQSLSNTANLKITIENLDKIGYNSVDNMGYRVNKSGKRLSFSLLVNSENRSRVLAANEIASNLKAAGIEITVVEKPYAQYISDLASGNFQLYLGEINILQNMDLRQLVLKGGAAAYGVGLKAPEIITDENGKEIPAPDVVANAINAFYNKEISISDVAGILLTEMPQIPICYRKALLFYNEAFSGVKASESDIYFNIESYSYKN